MSRPFWNIVLILANVAVFTLSAIPDKDMLRPALEFWPESQMAHTPAFKAFTANPNFPDGMTLRAPPPNTLARGQLPLHYQATPTDALLAGVELRNPFASNDSLRLERGAKIFSLYCQVCHGPTGLGNGPVAQHGFPPPPSLLADRARQMKDGQMFHTLTYGQGNMSSYAGQLSTDDRWCAVLHVRKLQESAAPSSQPLLTPSPGLAKATALFQENCSACHGSDGTGSMVRKALPLIPDFTNLAWQMSQTDIAIANQIDYGSMPLMPSFRYKLTRDQILELAVYVRSFALSKPSAPTTPTTPVTAHLTAVDIFQTFCFTCHDNTGKGNTFIRKSMPELPDFTSDKWQKSRTDTDLSHSILEGKGKFMLSMKDKLGSVNVKEMVALVRKFEGGKQVIPVASPKYFGPPPPDKIVTPVVGVPIPTPPAAGSEPPLVGVPGDTAARIRVGSNIFRQFCIVCHGPDGTGNQMRASLPPIPNFTDPAFQRTHTDAQLQVSILDGKGTLMPANRGRVTETEARDLAAYVRSFGPKGSGAVTAGTGDFEKRFNALQSQWDELNKELGTVPPPKRKP
jgi:cbb3-type cytochrome c oxidase subunit III